MSIDEEYYRRRYGTRHTLHRILSGELPGHFVLRTTLVSAFLDTKPYNPGHILVVPNIHCPTLAEVDEETRCEMFRVATHLGTALRSSGRCAG